VLTKCLETARAGGETPLGGDVQSRLLDGIQYKSMINPTSISSRQKQGLQQQVKNIRNLAKATRTLTRKKIPAAVATGGSSRCRDLRFSRREMVGTFLLPTGGFALVPPSASFPGFDLNPGNATLFPWLSGMAPLFEKYRFDRLSFDILPSAPTSVGGRLYAALDYDWDDTPATTATELMSNLGAVEGSLWDALTLRVDTAHLNQVTNVRYVADVTRQGDSQRLVYGGYLMIAASLSEGTYTFDLWVDYEVSLFNPALPTQMGYALSSSTSVVVPVGGTAFVPNIPVVPTLRKVRAGLDGVPNLTDGPLVGQLAEMYALGPMHNGVLELEARHTLAGSTPASYATDTVFDVQLYNSTGASLGALSSIIASAPRIATLIRSGIDNVGTWTVVGGYNRCGATMMLNLLRAFYPTLAYLVPYLYSDAGRSLGVSLKALQHEF